MSERRLEGILTAAWGATLLLLAYDVSDVWRGTALDRRILYGITDVVRIWLPPCALPRPRLLFYPEIKPLWGLLAGLWSRGGAILSGLPPNTTLRLLNALLGCLTAWTVYRAGRSLGLGGVRSFWAAAWTATNPLFLLLSVSGQSSTLMALLLALAVRSEIEGRPGRAAFWASLTPWVRMEGFLIAGVWFFWGLRLLPARPRLERTLSPFLSVLLYAVLTWVLFGRVLGPDRMYGGERVAHGLLAGIYPIDFPTWRGFFSDLFDALQGLGLVFAAAALPALVRWLRRGPEVRRIPAAAAAGVLLLQVVPYLLSLWSPAKGRYLAPLLPLLSLAAAEAFPSGRRGGRLLLLFAAAVVFESGARLARGVPDQREQNRFAPGEGGGRPFDPAMGRWILSWIEREAPRTVWITYDAYPVLLCDDRCILTRGGIDYGPAVVFFPGVDPSFGYYDLVEERIHRDWPSGGTVQLSDRILVLPGARVPPAIHWAPVEGFPGPIRPYRVWTEGAGP